MTPDLSQATWRKSTRSQNGGNCVEVATATHLVGVRDSKDRNGPALLVSLTAWQSFTTALRSEALTR